MEFRDRLGRDAESVFNFFKRCDLNHTGLASKGIRIEGVTESNFYEKGRTPWYLMS